MSYPLTGIQAGLGPQNDPLRQVPLRREIDEWWFSQDPNDANQRSLFIYALQHLQQKDPGNDKLSYFQIAGIHGQPIIPWDESGKPGFGYCTHNTPIFAVWHRPYVLLFEQRLYEIMKTEVIPREFDPSQQPDLQRAADTWRLPYWDWAMNKPDWDDRTNLSKYGPNVPYVTTLFKVPVRTRTGGLIVDNPLWKFSLPQQYKGGHATMGDYGIQASGNLHFEDCQASVRQPQDVQRGTADYQADFVTGQQQNYYPIRDNLRGNPTLRESVYRLMLNNYLPTYNAAISTALVGGQPTNYASLESIHNNIHRWTGGNGHMAVVAVSAFDPIFWLHHNNVERLACIWQDLHPANVPASWVDPTDPPPAGIRNPYNPQVQFRTSDPLEPFHIDNRGTHWTSNAARDWRPLGYTYPELRKFLPQYKVNGQFNEQVYLNDIRATVDKLYSTTAGAVLGLQNRMAVPTEHLATLTKAAVQPSDIASEKLQTHNLATVKPAAGAQAPILAAAPPSNPGQPSDHSQWEENDYIVNVRYEKFALGGNPFEIRIFLGDTPAADQTAFHFACFANQVGSVYNFSSPSDMLGRDDGGCANCKGQEAAHTFASGQVVITDALVADIKKAVTSGGLQLRSLNRDDVVGYLKKNLHWRITDINDHIVPPDSMPSVKISVAMGSATHYAEPSKLSEYRDYEVLYEVTQNRPCGANPHDVI